MPSMTTLFRWLRENEEFQKQYAQAKQESAHADDEMLQEIGDEAIKESKEVGDKRANAVVSAYKLKADNLKWAMSKKMPKKYGDKIDMTTNGKDLPAPILGFVKDALPSDNSNKESAGDEVSDQGSTGGNVGVEDSVDRPLLDTLSPIGQDANAD